MNKQQNKGLKKSLVIGALALTLSVPIGAGAASAASVNGQVYTYAQTTSGYGFDLNALLQKYFQGNIPSYTPPSAPVSPAVPVTPVQPVQPVAPVQPTTPVQPTNPSAPNAAQSEFATQVVSLVNQERANAGLNPLNTVNSQLKLVALDKAKDIYNNNYFDHISPTYGSPFDMMKQYGVTYGYAGENIAKGQRSPQEVMNGWMNSPGHRANILNANYKTIGVAYYNGVWVQEFIG